MLANIRITDWAEATKNSDDLGVFYLNLIFAKLSFVDILFV